MSEMLQVNTTLKSLNLCREEKGGKNGKERKELTIE